MRTRDEAAEQFEGNVGALFEVLLYLGEIKVREAERYGGALRYDKGLYAAQTAALAEELVGIEFAAVEPVAGLVAPGIYGGLLQNITRKPARLVVVGERLRDCGHLRYALVFDCYGERSSLVGVLIELIFVRMVYVEHA